MRLWGFGSVFVFVAVISTDISSKFRRKGLGLHQIPTQFIRKTQSRRGLISAWAPILSREPQICRGSRVGSNHCPPWYILSTPFSDGIDFEYGGFLHPGGKAILGFSCCSGPDDTAKFSLNSVDAKAYPKSQKVICYRYKGSLLQSSYVLRSDTFARFFKSLKSNIYALKAKRRTF